MAIEFKKEKVNGSQPAIWRGEVAILPGGFNPGQEFPNGTVLRRGIPLYVDFDEMKAYVCKTAKVINGGTTTKVRVSKGHYFTASDVVMKVDKTDASPSITSVDTSNADYDVLNLSAGIAGISEGDILVEATPYTAADSDVDAVPAAAKYAPNAIVGAVKEFDGKGLPTIDAGYEALVLFTHLPVPYLPDWVENGMCLKGNHSIKLIKQ